MIEIKLTEQEVEILCKGIIGAYSNKESQKLAVKFLAERLEIMKVWHAKGF